MSITIRPADKGGTLVVMETDRYVAEVYRQIGDVYERLSGDPTKVSQMELFNIIANAESESVIDDDLGTFLRIQHPVVP